MVRPVSVIIPLHDPVQLLPEAIGSVLKQNCPCREPIIVDDGSAVNSTRETVPNITPENRTRLLFVRQENSGAAVAGNRGISMASYEYLTFLDSDNLWRPRHCSVGTT
jgi:glycosyltransferase involved in cell wall biosynthesis